MEKWLNGVIDVFEAINNDISESIFRKKENVYSIDLPGVEKSDIKIKTQGESFGTFVRVDAVRKDTGKSIKKFFALDEQYDPDKCDATLSNGVLSLAFGNKEFPKTQERTIEVQ